MTTDQIITGLYDRIQDKQTFLHGDGDDSQYDIKVLQAAVSALGGVAHENAE
jgi:hypothetical protein